ncbi:RimK family alpha-L-glutamate ligase [Chitinophaga sp. Ak27]|uniref:ATP-grasp domain-containing protein n=1 Tax=Chitinophaga sp. Ak27 TaxID=2726116 RepID=UPI00145F31B1|nr:hypothetical protein [Chitinophaga sp. Ak27]NLU95482.1 hypothetical protein [Chitinophaga sp. Ak27]
MKIAYVGYLVQEKYATAHDEDATLLAFLKARGLDITPVVWNDPEVNWAAFDLAIIKSPWDYHEKFAGFKQWLHDLEAAGVALLNPVDTIRWNSDKHYLEEIAAAGLPVIPSLFLEKGTAPALAGFFAQLQADKLILKPCVSAGAKNTLILQPGSVAQREAQVHEWLRDESYIIQPFMEEIKEGEWSFLFFNGKYSHSLLKVPKAGDFRVQQSHGGSTHAATATTAQVIAAAKFVTQFAPQTLYARVDGVMSKGDLVLMELELIEPYLFLETHPDGLENYYQALLQRIQLLN